MIREALNSFLMEVMSIITDADTQFVEAVPSQAGSRALYDLVLGEETVRLIVESGSITEEMKGGGWERAGPTRRQSGTFYVKNNLLLGHDGGGEFLLSIGNDEGETLVCLRMIAA